MKNIEIADIFDNMAKIMECIGDNSFRINSYKRAAVILRDLTEDVTLLAKENRLKDLDGIGAGLAEKIVEYIEKGKIVRYEELKKETPEGLIMLLDVPGVGPKTAALLYKELKIKNINDLEKAVTEGKLKDLPGMGEKKEQSILKGIQFLKEAGKRISLGVALPIVKNIIEQFKKEGIELVSSAGSLRRMKETIGDIDILIGHEKGGEIISDFVRRPFVKRILAEGETKGSAIVEGGLQVDVRVVKPDSFGAALQYFTGSKEHNIRLREMAKSKGYKINEYGVFKGDKKICGEKEEDVYKALGLPWISPLLREDRGEIDAAKHHKLPKIISIEDIKGDLHMHSRWSDGAATIEEMVQKAKEIGYEYIAITDHSQSMRIAGGLGPKEIEKQIDEIKNINKGMKNFRILRGSEVDIKNDGSMDLSDDILEKMDFVIGAIHAGFKQDEETLTKRITTAMRNPHVDVIAHLSGRLIGNREAYELDMNEILKTAAETKTALEVNAHYMRLDLNDVWARRAKEMGVKISIGTDSHNKDSLWMMELGVSVCGRAWLEKEDILNIMTASELLTYLTKH